MKCNADEKKPRFSLIMATFGRKDEIGIFCEHLSRQTYKNFDLIVVDQNEENFLAEILARFSGDFAITHIRSMEKGLSHNRNIGLEKARGEIIAFPDDDSYYNDDTLEYVLQGFEETGADYFCVNYNDEKHPEMPAWGAVEKRWIRKRDAFGKGISFSLFYKREIETGFRFDERLGVGAKFGCGEETDLLLLFLANKRKCYYDGTYFVHHPCTRLYKPNLSRAYSYALGFGAIHKKAAFFYKNNFAFFRWFFAVCKNFLKIIFSKSNERQIRLASLKGKIKGFIEYKISEDTK